MDSREAVAGPRKRGRLRVANAATGSTSIEVNGAARDRGEVGVSDDDVGGDDGGAGGRGGGGGDARR